MLEIFFLSFYFFALYTCNQSNYPMFIFGKKNKRRREKFFTYVAVNLQGLFCKMAFRQQALLSTFSPPPTSRVCWWLRPCWRKKKRKKKKKKNANSPQFIEGSAPCASRETLCHGYKRSFTFLSARSPLAGAPMHTSPTSRGLDAGERVSEQKNSKNNSSSCVVWVRRSLEGTKCWKSTHTVLGWVFVHVMNVI